MPTQDTSEIKGRIISVIRQRGPSLPVHIARETGLSILFASAFLSELLSEKKIKISNMKVGSSPIYYLPGQETKLEPFSQYLNSKEREAFDLLKQKKILKDTEQEPPIRVALRAIKDFAVPLKQDNEIFWRYFAVPEPEFKNQKPEQKNNETKEKEKTEEKNLNIFDRQEKEKPKQTKMPIKKKIKKRTSKTNEKFFNKIKEYLLSKNIEISDIESFNKNEIILKVKKEGREETLIAFNKKRINEEDIIKAHKKSNNHLPYSILSLGEPLKKTKEFMNALKNLQDIKKIE